MGLITKMLVVALVLIAAWYAYGTVKIDTVTVCVEEEKTVLGVTCVEDVDCVKFLTSLYGSYPDTPMSQFILSEVSECGQGVCEVKDFHFEDVCASGELPIVYKVTLKEKWSIA